MQSRICKAIILKVNSFSDTQKIICIYSLEKGYLSMITPSSIFKRKSQPVHIMQLVEIEYQENNKGNLHKLSNIAPFINLANIYFDVVKMNIAQLWGEVLNILLRSESSNENVYNFISTSLEYLNSSIQNVGNFNLYFLYRLSGLIGYKIDTETYQENYVFNPTNANFSLYNDGLSVQSGINTSRIIYLLCSRSLEEIEKIPLNQAARNILIDTIFYYYETHINIRFNIKSIDVIRDVFR